MAAAAVLTIASEEAAAFLAAFRLDEQPALNAPDTTKSIAVGRSALSPGVGIGGKTSASAGLEAVPNSNPFASPWKYLPWKARPAGDASYRRNMEANRSCLATLPHPVGQTVVAWIPRLSKRLSPQCPHFASAGLAESS